MGNKDPCDPGGLAMNSQLIDRDAVPRSPLEGRL